ncbi:hypothetical protein EGW08_015105, partial [Elysia chlorotica]
SRLDRLFLLLESGSTPLIRKSAAEQLGDVVRLHPHELNNLLCKVHSYLRSPAWETRVAASQAVEAIAKNVPKWDPKGSPKSENAPSVSSGTLFLSGFDVQRVLVSGCSLLASEGDQYDYTPVGMYMDDKEQLLQQRQQLNKRLGLDIAGGIGLDNNLFSDEDLRINTTQGTNNNTMPVVDVLKEQFHLSSRERNAAKRKARSYSKQLSSNNNSEETCQVKRVKRERSTGSVDSNTSASLIDEPGEWPFHNFCEVLISDLFHSSWEVRHGAGSALREVVKLHGQGAGKNLDTPSNQLVTNNQAWLSDVALRLLCVLALDRFGDFVSDEVVAPVRETCAQTLGAVLKFLPAESVPGVVAVAMQLLGQAQWEVRHGALLSLKYILAVRQDLVSTLLPAILPAIHQGLQDPDDDVRAVAASALIPVTDALGQVLPDQIPLILSCLWNILVDLDDLTASTNSIMTLLAKLMSHPLTKDSQIMKESLTGLTPRLWPFLRHNIVSVRKAALETLLTLLTLNEGEVTFWLVPIYQDAVRHIYQRSVLEERAELLPLVQEVWGALLACAAMEHLYVLVVPWLGVWLAFLMQPPRMAFDPSLLIEAKHKPRESHPVKARFQGDSHSVVTDVKHYIGGCSASNVASPEKDVAIYRARVCGSRLLGMLADCLSQTSLILPPGQEPPATIFSRLFGFHLQGKSAVQRFVVGQVIYFWASLSKSSPCPPEIVSQLLACLGELIYFDEIAISFTRMQSDCQDFLASLKQEGVNLDALYPARQLLTLESALSLTTTTYAEIRPQLKPQVQTKFDDRQKQLLAAVQNTSQVVRNSCWPRCSIRHKTSRCTV